MKLNRGSDQKNTFTASSQANCWEARCIIIHRGYRIRCKPLVSLVNRRPILDFTRKHLSLENNQMTDETKTSLYQHKENKNMEKERNSWCMNLEVNVMAWNQELPVEPGHWCLLLMCLLMKAAGWVLKCTELHSLLTFNLLCKAFYV